MIIIACTSLTCLLPYAYPFYQLLFQVHNIIGRIYIIHSWMALYLFHNESKANRAKICFATNILFNKVVIKILQQAS